jgi:hypothetical protein
MFDPELVVYNAGTDILDGDPLGRLKVICSWTCFGLQKILKALLISFAWSLLLIISIFVCKKQE